MPPFLSFKLSDPLARVESQSPTTTLHEIDESHMKRSTSIVALHWCYVLHAILLITQALLLAFLWGHPEHNVTIAFENSVLTVGLSAFLEAFYTLYTALLVFITQRLAVSHFLSRPQKLTATHDISGAWAGLGAAAANLWKQTEMASSTKATLLILFYLSCVSVLHVASPTIMEFEAYNATSTTAVPSNSTWPNPSVNLSTLNMGTAGPLITLMSGLSGLSTDGLINSTLYDTFQKTPQMVNASVNASTIRANCGLLPSLNYTILGSGVVVGTSINGTGETSLDVSPSSLSYDEVLLLEYGRCTGCIHPLVYLVSTGMHVDGSIRNNVSLDIVLDDASSGGQAQNTSTVVYLVACSLEVSNYEYNLEIQNGILEPTMDQPDSPSDVWSMWTPLENGSGLGTQLDLMVVSAYLSTTCTGVCYSNGTLDDYLMSLIGINTSTGTSSSAPSVILSPYQLENAVSQMAAQLIWIAGQLGEDGGEFAPTPSVSEVTEQLAEWRLNINGISVVCTFSASLFLLIMVYLMLGVPSKITRGRPLVEGATVLEMLWIGAHSRSLRRRLQAISLPSSEMLRSGGMFDINVVQDYGNDEGRGSEESLLDSGFRKVELEDSVQGTWNFEHRRGAPSRIHPPIKSPRRFWCYLLHGIFVLFHVVLLSMLVRHPEHNIVLQSVNGVSTTALASSLQLFYIVYTLALVFVTQRLAVSRAMARKQCLTRVHDLSQAWTSIGSALVGLWQQTKVPASVSITLAIATYYVCILVLHVASTTIIQFEVFSSSRENTAQSTLAWPASFDDTTYEWSMLSTLVPLDQLPSLSTQGLVNNTVYDTPLVDSTSVNATVNATTIHAHCGLLSNVSLGSNSSMLSLNAIVPTLGPVSIYPVPELWKDTVLYIGSRDLYNSSELTSKCSECANYLLYWVTTDLDANAPLGDVVSVSTNWTYTPPGGHTTSSNTTAYVVACSLNATTTLDVLDVQDNTLMGTRLPQSETPSQSWPAWSPGGTPALGNEISMAISNATFFDVLFNNSGFFSVMDAYMMSLFGLNVTANNVSSATASSAHPSVTLTPSQFEDAVAQIAAQYVWAAVHTNSHPDAVGASVVTSVVDLRRLHVNTMPVILASTASVVLCALAVCMVGRAPSAPSVLAALGVLETLWLDAHLDVLHARMRHVAAPTLHRLRVAGMVEVALADEVRAVVRRRGRVGRWDAR